MGEQNYVLLNHKTLRHVLSRRSFGFSRVRFLPKDTSVRPLANLQASSRVVMSHNKFSSMGQSRKRKRLASSCEKKYPSVNSVLRETHVILKGIEAMHPQLMGSSVSDYDEVYQKLHQYNHELKRRAKTVPEVYIVVADVSKAFDSMDQDMLLRVMDDALKNDEYILRDFTQLLCGNKKEPAYGYIDHRRAGNSELEVFLQMSEKFGVFSAKGSTQRISKEELKQTLFEHVKRNIVHINGNYYLQTVGIPQGSILSSLLCCFYYGHLERNVLLPFLDMLGCEAPVTEVTNDKTMSRDSQSSDCLLMRFIDDLIFVSSSKQHATSFFNRITRGFTNYNCFMNHRKFGLNFDTENSRHLVNRLYAGDDGVRFLPWSGLLINCNTLEIQADYTRYCGIHISSTITVKRDTGPHHLEQKLCDYMRPKCHPIFYDSNMNSPSVTRLNAYQAFLLCTMKFHAYVSCMAGDCPSAPELLKMVERSFRYFYNLISQRMRNVERRFNVHCVLKLRRQEVMWLGLSAYIRVLRRKQSRHKELLVLLRRRIEEHAGVNGRHRRCLR